MKKIHMMIAALLAFLPTALFADTGSSTTYYAALKVQVSSSGGGMVYASDSSNTPSDSSFNANQSTKQSSGSFSKFCFCAHAKAKEGYRFTGWTGDVTSSDISCKVLVTSTSTSSSTYTTKTVTANFEQLPPATVTFAAPANGSYTVNGEAVNAQLVKSNQPVPYSVTLVATPASNFRFAGWYVLENGNKSFFSTDALTTKKFDVDVTVGAEFIPDGYAIYAARAAKGYDNLATALAEAEPGESISVFSSAMLNSSAAVPFGVSLTVASGATLTVASGATLYIDGSVSANGTIDGTVSKCMKLIKQAGQSDGVPFNPYGSVKYWKTSISTPSISVSSSQTHVTIVNGLGQVFRPTVSSSAKLIKCTIDSTVAVNHIKSISGESTSVNVVNATLDPGMVILLGSDCVINGGLTSKAGFRGVVDCANNPCTTVSGVEVSGNNGLATFLNCPSFTMNKVINITHDYYNCDIVLASNASSFNAGNTATLKFYDCGTIANPAPDPFNGKDAFSSGPSSTTKFHFYSGYYDSISYLTNFKIYGGSYKSDPMAYIVDTDNFESVYDSVSKYYNVQEKVDIVNVVAIDGKEYASLSEAVSAASNGATISLIEAVDLTGTTVTIPAGKTLTIATDKHSINGGKIVNNGTLLIVDATIENEGKIKCDIENNGTLDLVFGTYSGAIVNKAGTLTTHNGVFMGTLTKNGGTVNINGGHFAADPSELVSTDGYIIAKDGAGRFCVCEVPNGAMYAENVSGITGYGVTPYTDADFNVMYSRVKESKTKRSDYSDANWRRLAELLGFYEIYYNKQLDATLIFDRDVAAKSVNLYAKSTIATPVDLKFDLQADEPFRALTATITATGAYAKQYKALWEENIKSVAMAVSDKYGNNVGTVCTAMIELWDTVRAPDYHDPDNKHMITNTVFIAAEKRFTIGAGNNVAMIRPEVGAATFYATVSNAVAAAEDGGTVLLANDVADAITLAKAGTFIVDPNGFALSGEVSAVDPYFIEKTEEVDSIFAGGTAYKYTIGKKGIVDENGYAQASIQDVVDAAVESEAAEVTITIPETTTEQTVVLPEDKTLIIVQAEESETVVTVTPPEGHFVEATVVEPAAGESQSGTTTIYESKKITEEVVTVTEESVQELNVKLEEVEVGSTETNEVSEVAKIVEAVNNLMENKALERADNVEQAKSETINLKAIVITPKAIVQEVQESATEKVVKAAAFDVTPTDTDNKKIENTSFTFRLPVADGMTGSMVVFHEKVFFGVYPILTWSDGAKQHKYIEITSSEFSEYSYEPRRGVEYAVAKIGDVGYDSLEDAVAAAAAGAKVELLMSTTLTNEIAVAKAVTLDLGEFTVTAASGKSAIQVVAGGDLTVQGAGHIVAESTKFALYTDYELSPGAKTITIKGGVFDGALQFNKYPLHTSATQSGEAAVPTTVVVNGGTFKGRVSIYHCPFTVNRGTFEQGLDTSDGSVTVYANYKCPVTVNGGSFKVRPTPAGSRIVVNGGVYYEGGYFKVGSTAACQATRNGTYYASLDEAFQNIGPNTVITVLGGDASSVYVELEPGQSLTVPSTFDGNKITGKGGAELVITSADGTATYMVKAEGAARIGAQYYATLQAAFDASTTNDVITLLGNDTLAFTSLDRPITLDLNGHDVTVTSGAANLSAGALTVVGSGRMTGLVEPSTGKQNLILKGGTYGFNPSKYVPSVIEALRDEKDSLDWNNDRHYVFKNAAFVDGYWMTTDSGVWTVVPVPKAYVSRIAEAVSVDAGDPLNAAYTFNSFNTENGDSAIANKVITGDGQLNLNALTDPAEIARALVMLQEVMPFLGWHADFAVSFDKPITAGSVTLAGQYDGWSSSWVSYLAPNYVDANVIHRLLVDEGGAAVDDWSFEHICTKVKVFNCGARMEAGSLAGTTMKVQLRLYAPETDEGTGSPSIGICEYKYTFGGKAARIEDTTYDTIDAAIEQVQSNDVVVVLNDYTGAVDLNSCDKPFTVNRNGFVLEVSATNNINTSSDWHFDRLSNGSWSYYNKPQPPSADVEVVMVEVVDQDGEAVSLSTLTPDAEWLNEKVQEGESNEEALAKVEENGLPAWQNYVIGLAEDPDTPVRVDAEQSATVEDTPVVNTFADKVNVPENSGFKVTYELDKVDVESGSMVAVSAPTNDASAKFALDLSAVESSAFYKVTAIIEADDGTGAKTKVASENTIGVLKVTSVAKTTPVAVPWESLSGNGPISVSDIVRTANLTVGDELKAYAPDGSGYKAWTLNAAKEWEPATVVGGSSETEADAFTVKRGSAVWLTRQDTSTPIYLVGGVAESKDKVEVELKAGTTDNPSWNLVGSAGTEPVNVNAIGAATTDKIIVPTATIPKNYEYVEGQGWGYWDTETYMDGKDRKRVRKVFKTDTTIPAGTGFWYQNSGEAQTIEL